VWACPDEGLGGTILSLPSRPGRWKFRGREIVPIASRHDPPQHEETDLSGGRHEVTRKRAHAWLGAVVGCLLSVSAGHAADATPADLEASLRALGFLSSLQNRSAILIGVIYNGSDPASRAQAARAAADLSHLAGPGSSTVTAIPVAAQDLGAQKFDAVYLMSLGPEAGRVTADYVRHQSVVSVSSDAQCLDAQTCVLLVQARTNMSVVLDTALAKQVGAKFSTVFTMLVKRK